MRSLIFALACACVFGIGCGHGAATTPEIDVAFATCQHLRKIPRDNVG